MRDVIAHTNDPQQVFAVGDLSLMIKDLDSAEAAYNKAQTMGSADPAARGLAAVAKGREDSAREYRLANDLLSKKRTRNIAFPRMVGMYLARKLTGGSFPSIGERFGGRDHSTVIHASNTIERRLKNEHALRVSLDELERLAHSSKA